MASSQQLLICLVDAARTQWRISSVPLTHSLYFTIHSLYFTSRLLYELAALCHSMIVSNIILDTVPNLPGGKRAEPYNIAKGSSYLQSICGIFKGLLHLTRSEVSQVACDHSAHYQRVSLPLTLGSSVDEQVLCGGQSRCYTCSVWCPASQDCKCTAP